MKAQPRGDIRHALIAVLCAIRNQAIEPGPERFEIGADARIVGVAQHAVDGFQRGRLIGDETSARHDVLKQLRIGTHRRCFSSCAKQRHRRGVPKDFAARRCPHAATASFAS
jgi:hypothetical protein